MTTHHNKGGAKPPRQRPRKTDRKVQRGEKAPSTKQDRSDQAPMAEIAAGAELALAEQAKIEHAAVEQAPVELATMEDAPLTPAMAEPAPTESESANDTVDTVLSGEVLPPDRSHVTAQPFQTLGLQTIAAAYLDYARKSWAAGRMLAERIMATCSPEEVIEAHGDFAKQTHANFLAHSQKLCELYAEYTRQFFRPWETFATQWTRAGR